MMMNDVITMDPKIRRGKPVFRGTRVPVKLLFQYLEHDRTLDQFVKRHPDVSRQMAQMVLEQARARFN